MTGSSPTGTPTPTLALRFRRVFHGLRIEGQGRGREAAAIALGLFIGCLPFYGFHLLLCWLFGTLFRLNRLKVYVAANISNPFIAPWLLFAELQIGSLLRHGTFQGLTIEAVKRSGVMTIGGDLLLGSVVLGAVLGVLAATATYAMGRQRAGDTPFMDLVQRASDRYMERSIVAWEFARGKLRGDPIYRAALIGGLLPSGGTLIDVGCGQGLMLALLAEARGAVEAGRWPPRWPAPPMFTRLIGVEIRPRVAAAARAALGDAAVIVEGDARTWPPRAVDAVLLFDVLHMIGHEEQEQMLASMAKSLASDGVVLVREADGSAGWAFTAVRAGNRLKALAFGHWRQSFHFRTREQWVTCFAGQGFEAAVRPMGDGTPFGNVLFALTLKDRASDANRPGARPA